jgi:hypothetical protein
MAECADSLSVFCKERRKRMNIESLNSIMDSLFTGLLEEAVAIGGTDLRRSEGQSNTPPKERVAVSIGRPEWWNLHKQTLHSISDDDPLLRDLFARYDMFLVQFACSLTPQRFYYQQYSVLREGWLNRR